jgi:serine/threonine protein kinase
MQEMPPPDWQALSALYDQAEALPPAERKAWLARLEGQAHPMAPRLRKMLAAPTAFLHALPQWHEDPPGEADELHGQAGQQVGAYRLLRPLGAGGMAEVWLAERADGSFERQVALKLLSVQAGAVHTQNFRRRFEREHRILATLRHEHIAALFDAGVTAEGQHWLALEYVQGQAIDAWCDAACLGLRARVRLFRQVLQAVAHAHARLVIHRDLKPANVMVTDTGQVRLLDFGIATLLEDETEHEAGDLTRSGGRPMTPRYASPEQLQGLPLNATSDVYTLGVMLYELLCGQPPYAPPTRGAGGSGAVALAILAGEPLPPSQKPPAPEMLAARGMKPGAKASALQRQIKGELDAIVLRAMALESHDRYGSADAFDADLARWLAGEPVQARRPGPLERLWKFARRQPVGTGLGVSALLALSLTAAVAFKQASQARAEAARAQQASGFMLRLFEDADPDRHAGKAPTPAELLVLGRQRLLADAGTSVVLKADLLEGIGRAQNEMLEYDAADASYAQWLAMCANACEADRMAWAYTLRAENDLRRSAYEAAGAWLQAADALVPVGPTPAALQAKRQEVRGWLATYQNRPEDAERAFTLGLQVVPPDAHRQAAQLWQGRASHAAGVGDSAAAMQALAAAGRHVAAIQPDQPILRHNLSVTRAQMLFALGEYQALQATAASDLKSCNEELQPASKACRLLRNYSSAALIRLGRTPLATLPELLRDADAADNEPQRMNALQCAHRAAWESGDAGMRAETRRRLEALERETTVPRMRLRAWLELAEGSLSEQQPQAAQATLARARELAARSGLATGYLGARLTLAEGLAWVQLGQAQRALDLMVSAQQAIDASEKPGHPLALWLGLNQVEPLCLLGRSDQALARIDAALPALKTRWGASAPAVQRVESLRQAVAGTACNARQHRALSLPARVFQ